MITQCHKTAERFTIKDLQFFWFLLSLCYLLDGLVEAVGAVWHHQSGGARNHPVIVIENVLLQREREGRKISDTKH